MELPSTLPLDDSSCEDSNGSIGRLFTEAQKIGLEELRALKRPASHEPDFTVDEPLKADTEPSNISEEEPERIVLDLTVPDPWEELNKYPIDLQIRMLRTRANYLSKERKMTERRKKLKF